ncbi:MAG: hypothetical protein EYC70_10715 [Planctomycetota bacterium]|nr:MAG: hypothetical protein EYC70_10715 [Planctomycetota bacterium]
MKPFPLLLAAAAVAVGASAMTRLVLDGPAAAPADDRLEERIAGLEARLAEDRAQREELTRSLASLQQRLDLLSAGPAPARVAADADIDAAVARWMAQNAQDPAMAPAVEPAAMTVADAMAQLMSPDLGYEEREELWKKIRDAGLLEEVIAEMETLAAANPANAELQFALGNAYLQPIFAGEGGPQAGVWATKSDAAFDRALEINPQYWDARFSKAVSLSFWPPVLGKQGEAIQQFEMLLQQQAGSSVRPEYAQTYMFLGNLYQQIGNPQRALEVWNQGLGAFPSDAELRRQVELAGGN